MHGARVKESRLRKMNFVFIARWLDFKIAKLSQRRSEGKEIPSISFAEFLMLDYTHSTYL